MRYVLCLAFLLPLVALPAPRNRPRARKPAEQSAPLGPVIEWRQKTRLPDPSLEVDENQVRDVVRAKLIESIRPRSAWVIPSMTLITPSAYGAEWTEIFAGLGVENRARFNTVPNSTFHLGLGIGDAEVVALETALTSYGTVRHGPPFTIGGVSLKLHRSFNEIGFAAAIGYENAIVWGTPDSGQSYFVVVSKYFLLRDDLADFGSILTLHAGLGDGRFRLESDVREQTQPFRPFGAVGLRLFQPLSMILNWTGSDLALGVSIAPFRATQLAITFAAVDLAHIAGDGERQILAVSYAYSWR